MQGCRGRRGPPVRGDGSRGHLSEERDPLGDGGPAGRGHARAGGGLREGGEGLPHGGVRPGHQGGDLVGQGRLRGGEGPHLPGQVGVVEGLGALVDLVLLRRPGGLLGRLRRLLLHEGELRGGGRGVLESSAGQRALYGRAADGGGVGAGREDDGLLGRLRAGRGGVQVAVGQAAGGVHGRGLRPDARRRRGGGAGVQGGHLLQAHRGDGLHHLPVVLHDLLQDLILLVVENPGVEVLLELLQEDRVLLPFTERQKS